MPEWWVGRKHSEETKAKMRKARLGTRNHFYGRRHTESAKSAISVSRTGKATGQANCNWRKPRPLAVRLKISKTRVASGIAAGANNPNWQGGITKSRKGEMETTRYKEWRKAIFERDNYTCQMCPKRGGHLQADHIKPWAFFPELRYDVKNGRTLCLVCHRKTFKELSKWRDS